MDAPINIFSGEPGLGGKLTFPTKLSLLKGSISKSYPVLFEGVLYPDAESCYHTVKLKSKNFKEVYVKIAATRFLQYPELMTEVYSKGGVEWLKTCSHITGASSESAKKWEGVGINSLFINLLCEGFILAENGVSFKDPPQSSLF